MLKRITFTGDILSFAVQDRAASRGDGTYDYDSIFEYVKKDLESDCLVGSLETTFSGADADYTHSYIQFNTPDSFACSLKNVGFDILSTASNHALDRGTSGLKRTIQVLDQVGISHTGTYSSKEESEKVFVRDFGETKVAFLSFTYGTNSLSNKCWLDDEELYMVDLLRPQDRPLVQKISLLKRIRIRLRRLLLRKKAQPQKQWKVVGDSVERYDPGLENNLAFLRRLENKVRKARENADIVIMCLHSGGQFNFYEGVGDFTRFISEKLAEWGVDYIIGNHAHCVLPVVRLEKSTFCAYALGNFCFTPEDGYYVAGRFADYSMLLHLFLDTEEKKIVRHSFSILKSVRDSSDYSRVYNVADLYASLKDANLQEQLLLDVKAVFLQATGCEDFPGLKKEYSLEV